MKIGVLGAGGWGSALANLLAGNGHEVIVWSIDEREVPCSRNFMSRETDFRALYLTAVLNIQQMRQRLLLVRR